MIATEPGPSGLSPGAARERPRGREGVSMIWRRSFVSSVGSVAVMMMTTIACSSDEPDPAASRSVLDDDAITVASFDFTESALLAEVYSQALEAGGFDVQRAYMLGPREFVGPALRNGLVELVPEYAGTAVDFISRSEADISDDVAGTHSQLEKTVHGMGITVLEAAPAQNANRFVVTRETAATFDLRRISDLASVAGEMTFGGPPECVSRRLCLVGLADVYGVRFADVLSLDAGGPLTRQALRGGHIDVGLMFSTDPALEGDELVVLDDDRSLQPAENITPLVRSEVVTRWGDGCTDVIDEVSRHLTTPAVRRLNAEADGATDTATLARVAAEWLGAEGLT